MDIKSWLKNVGLGMVKYGRDHSGHKALKSAVSEYGIDELSWFFECWYKFKKAKRYYNSYCVSGVRNGLGLLVNLALKSALSKIELMNRAIFYACRYKLWKFKLL